MPPSSSSASSGPTGAAGRALQIYAANTPLHELGGLLHLALLSPNAGPMLQAVLQWGQQWGGRQQAEQGEGASGEVQGAGFPWRWDEPNAAGGHTPSALLALLPGSQPQLQTSAAAAEQAPVFGWSPLALASRVSMHACARVLVCACA